MTYESKELRKKYNDMWRRTHLEYYRDKMREWRKRNPNYRHESYLRNLQTPEGVAKIRESALSTYQKARHDVLFHYGGNPPKCACCGENRYSFLTLHHVNGDGGKHRKAVGGNNVYFDIRRRGYPDGFAVLCFNCNCGRDKNDQCPHETERLSRK